MILLRCIVRWEWVVVIGLLMSWGLIKVRWETALAKRDFFGPSSGLTVSVREQVGQGAALAMLSGFRGVVADGLWLMANNSFEKQDWDEMRSNLELVCLLQPRSTFFWEMSAWHLAWNMSHAARYDIKEQRLSRRIKEQQNLIQAGCDLLDRGVKNIPDQYELWAARGFLRADKQKDYAGAAEDFLKASTFSDAPLYVYRQTAYNLERAEKWQEAYAFWLEIWKKFPDKEQTSEMRWDRVKVHIQRLEERLAIPPSQRLREQS